MLSDAKLRSLKPRARPYKVSDAEGLFILVNPKGSRLWRWSYRYDGKQKTLALGKYPDVSLSDARDKLRDAQKLLRADVDPSQKRKDEKIQRQTSNKNTFAAVAYEWFEINEPRWAKSYSSRLKSRMNEDLIPPLGKRPIASITPAEVLATIRKVEERDAIEMGRRILQMARQVFLYGIATSRCQIDPTSGVRQALRPVKPPKSRTPLRTEDIPEFYTALASSDADAITKAALKFTLLTFVRTSEIRGAVWSEFEGLDGAAPLWRIPAARMKMRKEHLVPLPAQAVQIVKEVKSAAHSKRLVFALQDKQALSENTLIFALYRLGFHGRATVHGFRSTASTILNEHGFNRDWIEKQLAHEEGSIRSIYNAAEWLEGRREMMTWWAHYLDRAAGTSKVELVA
jgi:integrase